MPRSYEGFRKGISLGSLHGKPLSSHTYIWEFPCEFPMFLQYLQYIKVQLKIVIITKPLGILHGKFPEFQHVGILKPWEISKTFREIPREVCREVPRVTGA